MGGELCCCDVSLKQPTPHMSCLPSQTAWQVPTSDRRQQLSAVYYHPTHTWHNSSTCTDLMTWGFMIRHLEGKLLSLLLLLLSSSSSSSSLFEPELEGRNEAVIPVARYDREFQDHWCRTGWWTASGVPLVAKIFRRLYGPIQEKAQWRIRYNNENYCLYKVTY